MNYKSLPKPNLRIEIKDFVEFMIFVFVECQTILDGVEEVW